MKDDLISSTQSSDIFSAAFLIPNVGAPFVIGLAVGYFSKKMLKLALFVGGGAIVLMFVSEYYGFFTVSDESLQHVTDAAVETAQNSGRFLINRLSSITGKGVSSIAGFYCGLKMG
jgi:uncharacterized membrane protein (Fun14 family)